jgi:hypothetical protein
MSDVTPLDDEPTLVGSGPLYPAAGEQPPEHSQPQGTGPLPIASSADEPVNGGSADANGSAWAPPSVAPSPYAPPPSQYAPPPYATPAYPSPQPVDADATAAMRLPYATAVSNAGVEVLSCPECGAMQQVSLSRRDASDFCRSCDYPLFWTPARVQRDRDDAGSDLSLRRLPGTVGRATIASLRCPHCFEPNAVTAQTCVRCGLPMVVAEQPPPPTVYVPPPPPPPVQLVPDKGVAWWVWALIGLAVTATVVLVALILTHAIG